MILTWIGDDDERIVPMFHRKIWNHWDTDMETRTNNNNEGYIHRLQKKIGSDPNIWECVEGLQKEEKLIAIDYVKLYN